MRCFVMLILSVIDFNPRLFHYFNPFEMHRESDLERKLKKAKNLVNIYIVRL